MKIFNSLFTSNQLAVFGFVAASIILMVAPVRWLLTTWSDSSYQSSGAWYLLLISMLICWSVWSPVANPRTDTVARSHRNAIALLVLSALLRLLSQLVAINVIGGIALTIDVYAILILLRLPCRVNSVSPLWLSVLFLFTLPFERIVQRILGYPMQEISASGSCAILGAFYDDLVCNGVRLQVSQQDVLVDLPCSGTANLLLSIAFVVVLNVIYKPRFIVALFGIVVTIALAIMANMLRISLLAIGIAEQAHLGGVDVMAQPWHDLIGYGSVLISLLLVFFFYKPSSAHILPLQLPAALVNVYFALQCKIKGSRWYLFVGSIVQSRYQQTATAMMFLIAAVVIVNLPRQAIDVSTQSSAISLPTNLLGYAGKAQALEPIEQQYFSQFGGHAQKSLFGPLALTVVQTSSPLRHLHSPADCLRGLGYEVRFLGTRFDPVPTALYEAIGSTGERWHIATSFFSTDGFVSSNVAEVIWHWLKNPGSQWASAQRITPWHLPSVDRNEYESAVVAALDLKSSLVPSRSSVVQQSQQPDPNDKPEVGASLMPTQNAANSSLFKPTFSVMAL